MGCEGGYSLTYSQEAVGYMYLELQGGGCVKKLIRFSSVCVVPKAIEEDEILWRADKLDEVQE